VGELAIPTAHNKNEKGGTHDCQENSVGMRPRKFEKQPDLPSKEKPFINGRKHHRKTKAKRNPEKPETRVIK
jgi:hypothetical protein